MPLYELQMIGTAVFAATASIPASSPRSRWRSPSLTFGASEAARVVASMNSFVVPDVLARPRYPSAKFWSLATACS